MPAVLHMTPDQKLLLTAAWMLPRLATTVHQLLATWTSLLQDMVNTALQQPHRLLEPSPKHLELGTQTLPLATAQDTTKRQRLRP